MISGGFSMFRLIGFVVVIAVLFFGFSSLQKWYEGKSTPEETVNNIREELGGAIKPNSETESDSNSDNDIPKHENTKNEDKAPENFSTEQAARNLLKNHDE